MAKRNNNKKYQFVFEETNIVSYNDLNILEESTTVNKRPKIVFEATLQTANERNNNKRYYSTSICESIVNKLEPKSTSRSLLMEIDHPMFVSDKQEVLKKRAGVVEINNSAALIRKIHKKDNNVIGEIETLSGFKGPEFAELVSKDRVNIGFSLRAMGSVEQSDDGTLMVQEPIMPVTYDIVSNPSHSNAKIMEFLPENSHEYIPESNVMYETTDDLLLLENHDGIVIDKGNTVITFINEVIDKSFMDIISKKIKFNI